ncbi:cobyrinate a,c-diamide synthase [Williamsia phyllosphaerae]|uniref:Hydrogenobyrinate a,c-diamide synthase n=1 Tax=Williamsia phyllosphaerae TaxID=885042 RepID=A0ABQ1V623_9NOCA|nr:cobyrinate a,c-diamide synthase [Williamsia phyllosphaerae]GGF40021.1 hydrogenobyrinate a,c-diamide synthase [Williamsia phyllosphaerae]
MVNPAIPTVVIAAPSSGSGKTTVATGLIGALTGAGHRVAPFKVGPDFIDPGYHAVAAGRPGRNLDPNLVGPDRVAPLFAAGCAGADFAVVEGVMGLFDGRITDDDLQGGGPGGGGFDGSGPAMGSTAHVAALIGAPVIVVVDASGHSQTLAAILHGLRSFDPSVDICGVILNRVGSPRHEHVLRQACDRVGLPVFAVLGRATELVVPSRHLGLIPAVEHGGAARTAVEAMAQLVSATADLGAVVAAGRTRRAMSGPVWSAAEEVAVARARADVRAPKRPMRVAVAGGAAFTFSYAEHAELLAAAGAEVVSFDPLQDPLPEASDAVIVGGGFPEEHVHTLAANVELLDQLRAHADAGRPIHAECAGLLYLARDLDGHTMADVLPVRGHFGPSLTLGYRDAVALADSSVFTAGTRITGHEFHRSTVEPIGSAQAAWGWRRVGTSLTDGVIAGSVHASYLHTHPAGAPESVVRLVDSAAAATADAELVPGHTSSVRSTHVRTHP